MLSRYSLYKIVFIIFCVIAMGLLYTLLGFVVYQGFSSLSLELIFSDTNVWDAVLLKQRVFDGIFPAIVGTLMLIVLSLIFAVVIGFFVGIYMAVYAKGRLKRFFALCFELLASVPSLLIGLFFLLLSIHLHRYLESFMPSLLLSSLALALLIVPYLIKNTQESLEQIPKKVQYIGLNLGLTPLQNLFKVLIPYTSKQLLSGVFLALGRACEDTAVIMLTGAVATAGVAMSIFDRYEALPFYIYYISTNYADERELEQVFAAALILLVMAMTLFALTKFIQMRFKRYHGYD